MTTNWVLPLEEKGTIYKTTNGGGLGIKEGKANLKKIGVFPNPTEETLQLVIADNVVVKDILYNLSGKLLKHYDKSERNLDNRRYIVRAISDTPRDYRGDIHRKNSYRVMFS